MQEKFSRIGACTTFFLGLSLLFYAPGRPLRHQPVFQGQAKGISSIQLPVMQMASLSAMAGCPEFNRGDDGRLIADNMPID